MDGEHYERLAVVETQVKMIVADFEEMKSDVKAIRTCLDQSKGGVRMLISAGTVGAAIGAAIVKVIPFMSFLIR